MVVVVVAAAAAAIVFILSLINPATEQSARQGRS